MKLTDNFFRLIEFNQTCDDIAYTIKLNASHPIFDMHFPENPVTPGVCIIQIVKELVEDYLECSMIIEKISRVRFMNMINPFENNTINIKLDIVTDKDNKYKVTSIVQNNNTIFSQLSLIMAKNTN